jgi:hypothetical protein
LKTAVQLEAAMHVDAYTRVVLTIIAACLLAIVFRATDIGRVHAAAKTTCSGEMKATSAGAMQASIGASYRIQVTCE